MTMVAERRGPKNVGPSAMGFWCWACVDIEWFITTGAHRDEGQMFNGFVATQLNPYRHRFA